MKLHSNKVGALLRRSSREEGGTLVETAVSCSVLFAMLFGICQMSLALYFYQFTSEASREATRWAMVRGSTSCTNTPTLSKCNATASDITTYVRGLGFTGVTSSNISVTPVWCTASSSMPTTWGSCSATSSNAPNNLVKVTVTYPISVHIPFGNAYALSISSTSQMVISQ